MYPVSHAKTAALADLSKPHPSRIDISERSPIMRCRSVNPICHLFRILIMHDRIGLHVQSSPLGTLEVDVLLLLRSRLFLTESNTVAGSKVEGERPRIWVLVLSYLLLRVRTAV
jgi:hypothetical protein